MIMKVKVQAHTDLNGQCRQLTVGGRARVRSAAAFREMALSYLVY